MRGLLLRIGLPMADWIARLLPRRLAYALADLVGSAWYRLAPARRARVGASLARVAAATGRSTDPGSMRRLVRRAFIEHARYYLELLRAPHYPRDRVDEILSADDLEAWVERVRGGAVLASLHLGNFEPFGHLLSSRGFRVVAPIEVIEPPELFEFLRARRGAGAGIEVIPIGRARRPMLTALREGDLVAIIADRDLEGDGIGVTIFGHPATLPSGPATLALMTGRPLVVAACMRLGPDRFHARVWAVEVERTGDRRADIAAMTAEMGRHFEAAIGLAPEQWWGSFQPYWSDQRGAPSADAAPASKEVA